MADKPYDLEKTAEQVPEIKALRLATIYGDESTSLVSLTHRVVIADLDGEKPQAGIPHLYLSHRLERLASDRYWGDKHEGDFPGWPAVFDYIEAYPQLLDENASDEGMPWSDANNEDEDD